MDYRLKEGFKRKYRKLLADDAKRLFEYLTTPLRKAIRVNTLKVENKKVVKRLIQEYECHLDQLSWYEKGYWIEKCRKSVGNTLEHQLGYYYIQSAASMLSVLALDPQPRDKVLDLCAAPGSKTTQIAQLMNNKGIIIANDVNRERTHVLGFNTQKCGVTNCVIPLEDGRNFSHKQEQFDKVLVDAPCSGTGAIRKNPSIAKNWSQSRVEDVATLQKQLLKAGFSVLKRGGSLVYSTCALAPEENEAVIHSLLSSSKHMEIKKIEFQGIKTRPGFININGTSYKNQMRKTRRIWPQDNDTQGFFIAKVEKRA